MDHFGSGNSYGIPSSLGNTVIVEGSIDVTTCPSHNSWQVCKPVNGWWKTEEIVGPFAAERCGWWGDGQTRGFKSSKPNETLEESREPRNATREPIISLDHMKHSWVKMFHLLFTWFWVFFTTILYKDNNSQNKKNGKKWQPLTMIKASISPGRLDQGCCRGASNLHRPIGSCGGRFGDGRLVICPCLRWRSCPSN